MHNIFLLKKTVKDLYAHSKRKSPWVLWVYKNHIKVVASIAEELAKKYKTNTDFVVVGALLHDIADTVKEREAKDHKRTSLRMAKEILTKHEFSSEEIVKIINEIIKPHSCNRQLPTTPEGKILATADAVAHFTTDFYSFVLHNNLIKGGYKGYKRWLKEKIERDYNKKLLFKDEKKAMKSYYEKLKSYFSEQKKEIIDIVDKKNKTLYQTTKKEAHKKGLLHRTVISEVIDSKGRWLLVRPQIHKQDAGRYVSPVGGHVGAGETELEALKREAFEEVGAKHFTYKLIGRKIYDREIIGHRENHFFIMFQICTDDMPVLSEETAECRWFTADQIRKALKLSPDLFGASFHFVVEHFFPELLS